MVRSISGFYFDEEKKKYFKILPNHVAPSGSKYSRGAVSKEKVKKNKDHQQARKSSISSGIQHAPILNHLFGAAVGMDREIGRRSIQLCSIWAYGLSCVRTLEFYSPKKSSASRSLGDFGQTITSILKDEATGTILVGNSSMNVSNGNSVISWMPTPDPQAEERYPPNAKSLVAYDGKSDVGVCGML